MELNNSTSENGFPPHSQESCLGISTSVLPPLELLFKDIDTLCLQVTSYIDQQIPTTIINNNDNNNNSGINILLQKREMLVQHVSDYEKNINATATMTKTFTEDISSSKNEDNEKKEDLNPSFTTAISIHELYNEKKELEELLHQQQLAQKQVVQNSEITILKSEITKEILWYILERYILYSPRVTSKYPNLQQFFFSFMNVYRLMHYKSTDTSDTTNGLTFGSIYSIDNDGFNGNKLITPCRIIISILDCTQPTLYQIMSSSASNNNCNTYNYHKSFIIFEIVKIICKLFIVLYPNTSFMKYGMTALLSHGGNLFPYNGDDNNDNNRMVSQKTQQRLLNCYAYKGKRTGRKLLSTTSSSSSSQPLVVIVSEILHILRPLFYLSKLTSIQQKYNHNQQQQHPPIFLLLPNLILSFLIDFLSIQLQTKNSSCIINSKQEIDRRKKMLRYYLLKPPLYNIWKNYLLHKVFNNKDSFIVDYIIHIFDFWSIHAAIQ